METGKLVRSSYGKRLLTFAHTALQTELLAHNRSYCLEFWAITWQTSVCCLAEKGYVDIMPGKKPFAFYELFK